MQYSVSSAPREHTMMVARCKVVGEARVKDTENSTNLKQLLRTGLNCIRYPLVDPMVHGLLYG